MDVVPALVQSQTPELHASLEATLLPDLGVRRQDWENRYAQYGALANFCSRLRDRYSQDLRYLKEYERKRIKLTAEIFSQVLQRVENSRALNRTRKRPLVMELGSGMGACAASPGNLALQAIKLGYHYRALDFIQGACDVCTLAVGKVLRANQLSEHDFDAQCVVLPDCLKSVGPETVDVIVASQLLQHLNWEEVIVLIEECKRVLQPWGWIIIQFPGSERNNPRGFDLSRTRLHSVEAIKDRMMPRTCHIVKWRQLSSHEKSVYVAAGPSVL